MLFATIVVGTMVVEDMDFSGSVWIVRRKMLKGNFFLMERDGVTEVFTTDRLAGVDICVNSWNLEDERCEKNE